MRYFLELAYKGTAYAGWQRQPRQLGVQQVVEEALGVLLQHEAPILGSGRTDAGVHAKVQFAHFDTEATLTTYEHCKRLNGLMPKDIAAVALYTAPADAHARYDATSRAYEYHIVTRVDPFSRGLACFYYQPLSIDGMNEAAERMLKFEDFKSFCASKTDVKHYRCKLEEAYWERRDEDRLVFHIRANRFLRGMVRNIVGTLLDVGTGKKPPHWIEDVIEKRERTAASASAPADGLYLTDVRYPQSLLHRV